MAGKGGRKNTRNKSVETAIQERRKDVARLYLGRMRQAQIGQQLGVAQSTIAKDLIAIRAEWKEERLDDIEIAIDRELTELEGMEEYAIKMLGTCVTREQKVDKDGDPVGEPGVRINQQAAQGWIDRRLKIKERRAKLLGMDAPEKRDLTSGGKSIDNLQVILAVPGIDPSLMGKGTFDGRDQKDTQNGKK